ncbi:MAG: Crp/Fnr family transcriptional regulator [Mangrovibacterium sp.]
MEFIRRLGKYNIPADLLAKIGQATCRRELPRNYHMLLPGNRSLKIFFFEKGLARAYYYKNGKDITQSFYKENDAFVPIESIFYNRPSRYGLELLEDSIIYTVNYHKMIKYMDNSMELNKLFMIRTVNSFLSLYDRIDSIQFHSAQERYNHMRANYPDIMRRAPLGHIASYLGITPQTLSVIRGQSCKRKTDKLKKIPSHVVNVG